jgi:hypothetical protein
VFLEIAFPPVQGHLVEWLTAITLIAGLITALWRWIGLPIRKEWMANKKFQEEFRSDWHGVEARPGVPGRPGVIETLAELRSDRIDTQARLQGLEIRTEANSLAIQQMRGEINTLHSQPKELS